MVDLDIGGVEWTEWLNRKKKSTSKGKTENGEELQIEDPDLLAIGLVPDMWTEKSNDSVKYTRLAYSGGL